MPSSDLSSLSRRRFLAGVAGAVCTGALGALGACAARGATASADGPTLPARMPDADVHPATPADAAPGAPLVAWIGTYTHDGRSPGLHCVHLDPASGALAHAGIAGALTNPSWVALGPAGGAPAGRVLAVSEVERFADEASGAAQAFARADDGASGRLTPVGPARATGGGAPCHLTVDPAGRHALVANYAGGSVAVLPIGADGALGAPTALVRHAGRGPRADRQASPHAHCVVLDPAGRHALVADLGADRVFVYAYDAAGGTLTPAATPSLALPAGAGPRFLAWHPSGRTIYLVNELDDTLAVLAWDAERATLAVRQVVRSTEEVGPGRRAARNQGAHVEVDPAGRFVRVSNRGPDTITTFAVTPGSNELTRVEEVPTGAAWPRHFALAPGGRFLVVAGERGDVLASHAVDARTGRLTPTGHTLAVPLPTCVRFAAG